MLSSGRFQSMPEARIDRFNDSLQINFVRIDQVPVCQILLIQFTFEPIPCIEF